VAFVDRVRTASVFIADCECFHCGVRAFLLRTVNSVFIADCECFIAECERFIA
jgi:hypothetical protein